MNRITDLVHLLSLSLSLCTIAWWAPRSIAAHRSASTSLCGRACASGENTPIPRARALFRPPTAGADSGPHAVTRTSGRVTLGHPTPPSLLDCRWSSFHVVVTRWPPVPQGIAAVSCDMPLRCLMLITMRQPTQHGPQAACLI
jgi:hypothetical protein